MKTKYNFENGFGFNRMHTERIGQLINYLALNLKHLYCTKLIKLLYIIDEKAMDKIGTPITWLTYKVYKMGPVPDNLWYSIKDGNSILGEYFDVNEVESEFNEDGGVMYKISAISKENMTEFSRREVEIIDDVINVFGKKSREQLVDYLHREDALWSKIVSENNISFEKSFATSHIIDLSKLIGNDKYKLNIYHDAVEEIKLLESLS